MASVTCFHQASLSTAANAASLASSRSCHVSCQRLSFPSLACSSSSAAASGRPAGPVAVRAVRKADELKEIRAMSTADIEQNVVDLKGELFLLRAKQATRLEFKGSEFGRIHKRIARMLTVRREREMEQGVDKRASRKLDKAWKKSIVPRPPPSYNPEEWKK
eukprot:TRINITY_DN8310_c0_g1_i1.p1 TRINITY_DN8310_c0_g1~~TRINITY_DN8310_c0_g1_i1.p1  ORF type:complete len:162 (-),score=9.30 TRINITY_DN8310_c0_g1_i1:179-664(-)